jgi:hypothetical protein
VPSRFRCGSKRLASVDRALTPDEPTEFINRSIGSRVAGCKLNHKKRILLPDTKPNTLCGQSNETRLTFHQAKLHPAPGRGRVLPAHRFLPHRTLSPDGPVQGERFQSGRTREGITQARQPSRNLAHSVRAADRVPQRTPDAGFEQGFRTGERLIEQTRSEGAKPSCGMARGALSPDASIVSLIVGRRARVRGADRGRPNTPRRHPHTPGTGPPGFSHITLSTHLAREFHGNLNGDIA